MAQSSLPDYLHHLKSDFRLQLPRYASRYPANHDLELADSTYLRDYYLVLLLHSESFEVI